RKISEDFSGDFALVAARPEDARNYQPAWSFTSQREVRTYGNPEIMTARRSIFKDFQSKPLTQFHSGCAKQCSNRFRRPALPPDETGEAQIFQEGAGTK